MMMDLVQDRNTRDAKGLDPGTLIDPQRGPHPEEVVLHLRLGTSKEIMSMSGTSMMHQDGIVFLHLQLLSPGGIVFLHLL
jgi:hypothetical protein